MLKVTCYRHGQSDANAGKPTVYPETIELTALGWTQARGIAQAMPAPPELIVTSPFTRALQSATPTMRRFPDIPNEIWDIAEFTYLSPSQCMNTTALQRKPWVDAYWARNDIHFKAGEGAESFAQFIARADNCLGRLKELRRQELRNVALFGHGQFFQALRWLATSARSTDTLTPSKFRAYDTQNWIANGSAIVLSIGHDKRGADRPR